MRLAFCLAALPLACGSIAPLVADDVPLVGEAVARFASVEEGAAALKADDDFTRSLSRFDLQCRLQKGGAVSLDDWRDFTAGQVLAWEERHTTQISRSLARLRPRLEKFNLPLPQSVLLVRTTGKEEGNAAYTRGAAIILPDKVLAYPPEQFDRLLVHELFHVLSRHQPMLRSDLYAVIGFQTCPPIALPPSLKDRKLTNPDAPLVDCYIELSAGDKTYVAAPVLYASAKEFDPQVGGTLFKYLTFRLMVIEKHEGQWRPVMKGEQPVVIDPTKEPAFFDKVGRNTKYIIHPDEILADNFVHLVLGEQNVATPRILERMGRVLEKE
jgi:hypothetical protein